jgi:hypothetical protein
MIPDSLETLIQLGASRGTAVYLNPAASDEAIAELQIAAQRHLGEDIPAAYLRMLRRTNGVQINGAYFKEAENLVAENLDVPRPEIIVLGNSGNNAEFVFDKRDRQFHTINMGYPDERFASFTTFDDLLRAVLVEERQFT